jgi:hypothetical protein
MRMRRNAHAGRHGSGLDARSARRMVVKIRDSNLHAEREQR